MFRTHRTRQDWLKRWSDYTLIRLSEQGGSAIKERRLAASLCLVQLAPMGIRIPVLALKGPRPSPLDDGGVCACLSILSKARELSNAWRLFNADAHAVAEIPWNRFVANGALAHGAQFVYADLLLGHSVLEQCRRPALTQCEFH